MDKFYVVKVLETKDYAGEIESGTRAVREARNKFLTYVNLEDAVYEYKNQVQRAEGVIGYASRHNSLDKINIMVFIAINDIEMHKDYCYCIEYDAGVKSCKKIVVS